MPIWFEMVQVFSVAMIIEALHKSNVISPTQI